MTVTMTHSSKMDPACAGHLALRAMSDHGPFEKNHRKSVRRQRVEIACKGHQLRKKKEDVTSPGSQADVKIWDKQDKYI